MTTIAEKTHAEILSMTRNPRFLWYKTISSEEKKEAMEIVDIAGRAKRSVSMSGKKNHMYDNTHSKESKAKISAAGTGRVVSEETRARLSIAGTGRVLSEETRAKMSGENNSRWKNGASFKPYCPLFNIDKKEEIRNRDERRCQLCGKSEILNGMKLDVHHINSEKMQGCNGIPWYLCALCRSCNSRADTLENEFLIVSNLSPVRRR
ncbi:MAG: hypothetical protein KGD60_14505 [Candidatus Thorarchaeota archaeon]|nr:hypothetical protein [Candidatus Thorarchaeota archaeon]